MNFFQLPIGAGANDPVVGQIDGAQIRMAPDGTRYYEQYTPPAKQAIVEALTTTLDDQGRASHDRAPQQPVAGKAIVDALLGGVTQGLTAPGRAARGEPVTYGDAWATALDYGALSAPTSAPEGALRSAAWNTEPMYHGTPDVRDLRAAGGFEPRTKSVSRLADVGAWEDLQARLSAFQPKDRGSSAYAKALDDASDLVERVDVPSPVFFSPNRGMAASYADDTRAFDYQNAIPEVLTANTTPQKILDVSAGGESFRGISKEAVKKGLAAHGVPDDEVDAVLKRYIRGRSDDRVSTDDLSAIAADYGFDAVDVSNVKDSYFGGGPAGRVRMMLNMDQIDVPGFQSNTGQINPGVSRWGGGR